MTNKEYIKRKIDTEQDLKSLLEQKKQLDVYILFGGYMKSSKSISMNQDGSIYVFHAIDGTQDTFKDIYDLLQSDRTNIRHGIKKGCFYAEYWKNE
jgi:hypothetical protein